MIKCSRASSSSSQAPEVKLITLDQRRALMFKRQLMVKWSVSTLDFQDYTFEGGNIHLSPYPPRLGATALFGWPPILSNSLWVLRSVSGYGYRRWVKVVMRGVTVRISLDIIAQCLGLLRPAGAYPTTEPTQALRPKKIFEMMSTCDQFLIQSSMPQRSLTSFWRMLHPLFINNINSSFHNTEYTTHRARFMLMVEHLESIDLPLYMFQAIWTETLSTSQFQGLPYEVMLSCFLMHIGVEVRRYKPATRQLDPIYATTVQRSFALGHVIDSSSAAPHEPEVLDVEEQVKFSFRAGPSQLPPLAWLENVQQRMMSAFEQAIAPLTYAYFLLGNYIIIKKRNLEYWSTFIEKIVLRNIVILL